ncbi:MAG TPA: hypothetical protein PKZ65_00955 [Methanoregulaceae archaeon]|nr:hypothetical protein [Methanoregulaceae archaeon]
MMDQHPVTFELTADIRPRGVDGAGDSFSGRIFTHKDTPLYMRSFAGFILFEEFIPDLIGKFRLHMHGKDLIGDIVPAIVVAIIQLPFNFDKFPKTHAAFPTPGAVEFSHAEYRFIPV